MGCNIKTGDTVKHIPTGEKWIVAFSEEGRGLSPCGWPESLADIKDCILVKSVSEWESLELLIRLSDLPIGDIRGSYARRVLDL